jgi:hypothetical protein
VKRILVVYLFCFALVQQCFAWGREGHRLTAMVAEDYLTPLAQENVRYLLGKQSLADVSSWADEYREDHRETARWHFVNIPGSASSYDRVRDCPEPDNDPQSKWRDCVVDRILYFEEQLQSSSTDKKQKAFALKFLVHLVGDIHQPLHAIGEARGGNDIHAILFGTMQCGERSECNLHGAWDEGLLEHRNMHEKGYLGLLRSEIRENDWQREDGGDPTVWANASHRYAQHAFVPAGTLIDSRYYEMEIKVVDQQLALGGLRLAHVLNEIFTAPPSPSAAQ